MDDPWFVAAVQNRRSRTKLWPGPSAVNGERWLKADPGNVRLSAAPPLRGMGRIAPGSELGTPQKPDSEFERVDARGTQGFYPVAFPAGGAPSLDIQSSKRGDKLPASAKSARHVASPKLFGGRDGNPGCV